MKYEDLLDKALEELPKRFSEHERFTIEKVKGHLEGNKTIVINLKQIAKHINREDKHLLKYLLRNNGILDFNKIPFALYGCIGTAYLIFGITLISCTKINIFDIFDIFFNLLFT